MQSDAGLFSSLAMVFEFSPRKSEKQGRWLENKQVYCVRIKEMEEDRVAEGHRGIDGVLLYVYVCVFTLFIGTVC